MNEGYFTGKCQTIISSHMENLAGIIVINKYNQWSISLGNEV